MSSRVTTLSVAVLALLGISMPRISCIPTSPDTGAPGAIDVTASGALQGAANNFDANDFDANNVDANDSNDTLALDSVPVDLEGKWVETHGGTESKSIIAVSDHGTGSSAYVHLLSMNPCVITGGEAFGDTLWANPAKHSYFEFATGKRNHGVDSNPQLASLLVKSAKDKGIGWDISRMDHHIEDIARNQIHKVGDITEYFRQVTEYACEAMPQDVKEQCSNKCAVVYKWFPRYVGGKSNIAFPYEWYNTDNPRALELWSQTLDAMKSSPHFAMALLERDEQDRELSNFRRFGRVGEFFDCSLKRDNDFFKVARDKLSHDPTVEPVHCLSSKNSTMECLGKVLRSTGLQLDEEAVEDLAWLKPQHSTGPSVACNHGEMLLKLHSGVHVVKKRKEKDELAKKLAKMKEAMSEAAQDADHGLQQW